MHRSVLATRAVRASEVFFDAIYFSCRALAIAAAFNATASVGCGAGLAVLFMVSNALDARPLFAFVFETAREGASFMTSPSRDASNFLHGHAFQTPRAFHDSGRDHARDGLCGKFTTLRSIVFSVASQPILPKSGRDESCLSTRVEEMASKGVA